MKFRAILLGAAVVTAISGCGTPSQPPIKLTDVSTGWAEQTGGWAIEFSPDISFSVQNISNQDLQNVAINVTYVDPKTKKEYGTAFDTIDDIQPGYKSANDDFQSSDQEAFTIEMSGKPDLPRGGVEAIVTYSLPSMNSNAPLATIPISSTTY